MKFLIGKEKFFFDFVDSIKSDDKIGIITHTDLDGLASAFFLEKILESKGFRIELMRFGGYKKGMFNPLFDEFNKKKITKIFITDMNADVSDLEGFERLRKNFDCFWVDHHPHNLDLKNTKNILKSPTEDCSAWVLYNLGQRYFDVTKWDWLVCATMISEFSFNNKDNLKFIESKYPGTFKYVDSSEPKKNSDILGSALVYYNFNLRRAYQLIKEENLGDLKEIHKEVDSELMRCVKKYFHEAEYFPDKKLYFAYFYLPKFHFPSHLITVVSKKDYNNAYFFAADSIQDKGFIKISGRCQSGKQDVNVLIKKGIAGLEGASGGGHVKAAGAAILKKDLQKFKENLLK